MKNLKKIIFSNKILLSKLAIAFASGVGGAFAFAPHYLFSLLILSFFILLRLLFHAKSYKESFLIGWFFGCGYFFAGLYWIVYPLIFYFLDSLWWLIPFAVILIPCVLAVYHGVCGIVLHKLNSGNKVIFSLSFLCIWILFEVLRNKLFTGFPWLITGYSLIKWPESIQIASLVGVFGLSLIALSTPIICFLLTDIWINRKCRKGHVVLCVICAMIFCVNFLYGWERLSSGEIRLSSHSKIKIIQPNISTLLSKETMDENAEEIIQLAKVNSVEDYGLLYILLPEGGLNYFSKTNLIKLIQSSVPDQAYLISGGDRVDYSKRLAWNSVFVIDHTGRVVDLYDKTHLVPFGEYIPLKEELSATFNAVVSTFSNNFFEFSRGAGAHTTLSGTKFSFSPSICYESLFSRDVIDTKNSPQLLINFTTDKWYKNSSGPYQHFDMSRLRAVEFGLPLIRVSSTGISGVIDPYGRVLAKISLNKKGIISNYIPLALQSKTFYTNYGDTPIILLLSGILLLVYLFLQCKAIKNVKSTD
jgi:apolipoprotein N-acyltransferase